MKWKDLTLKERKQVYSNVRANTPGISYLDVKQQFDSVPAYEDGGKLKKEDLPPEYRSGTPEYFARQKRMSGAATVVQPEAYLTPAGYIKDAVNFVEDLGKGDYAGAAIDAALNILPWGVGKGIKKIKSKVGRLIEGTDAYTANSYAEPFTPTNTRRNRVSLRDRKFDPAKPPKDIEDAAKSLEKVFNTRSENMRLYEKETSKTVNSAIFPDSKTYDLIDRIDETYGTNYRKAYNKIGYADMVNRGGYVHWGDLENNALGKVQMKNIQDGQLSEDLKDYTVMLDPSEFVSGTIAHEFGHVADGLAGSRQVYNPDKMDYDIINKYLNYLANPSNAYTSGELNKMGLQSAANNRNYLLNPTEAKSHMLTLKRALKDSGKILDWSSEVTEPMVLNYMKRKDSNKMIKNQYDLYKNKSEFIERLNNLTPLEIIAPISTLGIVGYEQKEK